MKRFAKLLVVLAFVPAVLAHDVVHTSKIVIDTDMGIDDAVTLALALQNPDTQIVSIVACEGAAGREKCVENLERMLVLFNRGDIKLYAPAEASDPNPPPPFRQFAEQAVSGALNEAVEPFHLRFSPEAYTCNKGKVIVLALGPLTNLATALEARPGLKDGILKVVFAGSPTDESWNVRYDPAALEAVQAAGLEVDFVVSEGRGALKPEAWSTGPLAFGAGTSVGENFVTKLLSTDRVREHYLQRFERYYDELGLMYLVDETLFWGKGRNDYWIPNNRAGINNLFTQLLVDGRQGKDRVVFVEGSLPDGVLRKDVRDRKARIIEKNGQTEWFAQLLMNEMHEHLGAYSVIGVKMGLRAAELLNAPQHGMRVISHIKPGPPASCLNDGVIVATGCTPGRALYSYEPREPATIAVSFECNDRLITLELKKNYRLKIRNRIKELLEKHTLEDHEYWHGVRESGLDIWENWHRRDLFDLIEIQNAQP